MKKLVWLLTLNLILNNVFAGPVRVGNGDDGDDLQSFTLLTEGPIVESRRKAVELLKSYNIQKIEGLGALIPEVENTKLYMTKKGLSPKRLAELGAFTNDATGLVYARTMPEAYAATRFFPASKNLNESQLIALHIHEGLHRSLPYNIREDEQICSTITQAILAPETSRDKISKTVAKYVKKENHSGAVAQTKTKLYVPEKSRLHRPSRLGLEYRRYQQDEESKDVKSVGINSMYVLSSHLYPFGQNENAMGLGVDVSIVQTENENFMGPLSLSARYRLYTRRDFDIEGFAQLNMNSLSDDELKNSLMGRDTTKIGITLATRKDLFFIENDFSYILESQVEETIGNVDYTYTFGSIMGVNLRAGAHYKGFMLGGFAEILLSDNFIIEGGDFQEDTGRTRIVSWGPHLEYRKNQYSLVVKGRFILDSTDDTSYDYLSDLMGYGVGQGSLQTQFNVYY